MIDTAKLASILSRTNDALFQQQVNAAVAELERILGYSLSGTIEPEERSFPFHKSAVWKKVNPFYGQPTSVTLVNCENDSEETIAAEDYRRGQNGTLFGTWFNALKLCKCPSSCLNCYSHRADYIKVVATWGFAEPVVVDTDESGDESGQASEVIDTLPADLERVLLEAIKADSDSKSDIQSENTGTRSYSKFAKSYGSVWEKYAATLEFYRMREPRF
jgi:hypothetical protein